MTPEPTVPTPAPPVGPAARLRRLEGELGARIAGAVDVLEVAVVLESAGISDQTAVQRYGFHDVFDLARWMRGSVEPVPQVAPSNPLDWYGSFWLCLIRGWAYVFAGVMAMTAAGMVADPAASPVLLAASVVATAAMGWMSHLGHTAVQRMTPERRGPALGPLLGMGLAFAAAVGVVVGAATSVWVGVVGAIPLVYAAVAVVLLVLDEHLLFALAMLPGGVAAVWHLLAPSTGPSARFATSLAAAGLLALLLIAANRVRRRGGRPDGIGSVDLRSATPLALSGLALAGIVGGMLVAFSSVGAGLQAGGRQWFVLGLPFFVPLGLADVAVVAMRRRVRSVVATCADPSQLRRSAHRALAALWLAHGVVAAAMVLLATWLHPVEDGALGVVVSLGFLALGGVLVSSLVVEEFGGVALVVQFVAAAVLLTVGVFGRAGSPQMLVAVVSTCVVAAAMLTLQASAWRRSGELSSHRWTL